MLITTLHTPVPANLPALNLRLIEKTENPRERLEISEASVEALSSVPQYQEVAEFTQQALEGVTGTARRQAMLTAALTAMAAVPNMLCVGYALIGSAPTRHKEGLADQVLSRVESTSTAPELSLARRLFEDKTLAPAERAAIVRTAVNAVGHDATLLDATTEMLAVPFGTLANQQHASKVALETALSLVPPYSREVLQVALDVLDTSSSPRSSIEVARELLAAAQDEPGRPLLLSLRTASLESRGEARDVLLERGMALLKAESTVPRMEEAVDLTEAIVTAVGRGEASKVRHASVSALAEASSQERPILTVAKRVVELARYAPSQGGLGETPGCEAALVLTLEALKAQVESPQALDDAIVRLRAVEGSSEVPIGRSHRQAAIAARALQGLTFLD